MKLSGVCNFSPSVSLQQKCRRGPDKHSFSDRSVFITPVIISFIQYVKENTSPGHEACQPKRHKERRSAQFLAPLFMCFFLSPLIYNPLAVDQPEVLFVLPESSLYSCRPASFTSTNFMGFVPCLLLRLHHSGLLFLFYLTKALSM